MIQGKASILVLVALVVGFGAGFVLRPVIAPASQSVVATAPAIAASVSPEPRGTQYFAAHLDEARRIIAQCRDGSVRGDECDRAGEATTEAEGKERFRKFMGN